MFFLPNLPSRAWCRASFRVLFHKRNYQADAPTRIFFLCFLWFFLRPASGLRARISSRISAGLSMSICRGLFRREVLSICRYFLRSCYMYPSARNLSITACASLSCARPMRSESLELPSSLSIAGIVFASDFMATVHLVHPKLLKRSPNKKKAGLLGHHFHKY